MLMLDLPNINVLPSKTSSFLTLTENSTLQQNLAVTPFCPIVTPAGWGMRWRLTDERQSRNLTGLRSLSGADLSVEFMTLTN